MWVEGLYIADNELCSEDTFTFCSSAHHTVSWLDHAVMTERVFQLTNNVAVLKDFITSDHLPVEIDLDIATSQVPCDTYINSENQCAIPWDSLTEKDFENYKNTTENNLKSVIFNHGLLLCDDPECTDVSHINAIDLMCTQIADCLITSGDDMT